MRSKKNSNKSATSNHKNRAEAEFIRLAGRFLTGYGYGSSQPIAILTATQNPTTTEKHNKITILAERLWGEPLSKTGINRDNQKSNDRAISLIHIFIEFYFKAHKGSRWPLFEWHYSRDQSVEDCFNKSLLILPWWHQGFAKGVIEWSTHTINAFGAADDATNYDCLEHCKNQLKEIHKKFRPYSCQGVNMVHLLRDAAALGIPSRSLTPSNKDFAYRLGEGVNSKLFNSTITSDTPSLGVSCALSKTLTAAALANHGIPIPKFGVAQNEEDAIRIAETLGYPVVVKPDNKDGGVCVFAGLNNSNQVLEYFREAKKVASNIIIQSHIKGADYRVTVHNDKVIKVIRRVPGGVCGDGVSTISALVTAVQSTKASQYEFENKGKHPLEIDSEAQDLLTEMNFSIDTVPQRHQFVPLRRKANISTGGTQHMIDPLSVHPDNLLLARRCAAALYLDIAGIDLILADHTHSWIDTNGAVLEVNAQPQIGIKDNANIYKEILSTSLNNLGCIDYYLLIGELDEPNDEVRSLLYSLAKSFSCDGTSDKSEVLLRNSIIAKDLRNGPTAARLLLNEPSVKSVISYLSFNDIFNYGLPTNRIKSFWIINNLMWPISNMDKSRLDNIINLVAKNSSCPPFFINSRPQVHHSSSRESGLQ